MNNYAKYLCFLSVALIIYCISAIIWLAWYRSFGGCTDFTSDFVLTHIIIGFCGIPGTIALITD